MTVTRKPDRRGEHENKPLKPLRAGMSGDSGGPVVTTLVWFIFSHARLRVHRAPGIPHALYGAEIHSRLGRIAPRECGRTTAVFETALQQIAAE
jgi:hypothetical protein